MKKLFSVLLVVVAGIAFIAPVQTAEAQVIYGLQCCDSNAVIRCKLVNWTPVGNPCFCPGQGYGIVC